AVAVDDGTATTVELSGATFADEVEVGGQLILLVGGNEIALPARVVERDPVARRVRLEFPSLAVLQLDDEARELLGVALSWADERQEFDALYVAVGGAPSSPESE